MEITAARRQNKIAIAVDEFRKNANAVVKAALFHHIVGGHIINRVNLARIANAKCHAEIAQLCIFAAGHEGLQRRNGVHRLFSPRHFAMG